MKINDEGRSNAAYWHERAMKAEARLAETERLVLFYGGHVPPCPGRPCSCHFQEVWDAIKASTAVSADEVQK